MSHSVNDELIVRAYDLVEELVSDPAGRDQRILQLIEKNDLDNLAVFVAKLEGELSIEHFAQMEQNDVY